MSSPRVSVVVLNYNSSYETLKICLDSLMNQTYSNLEIVVVDNGSKNGVLERIEKEFDRIRIERLGKNYGFAGGVNRAVSLVKGTFIFILNFDTKVESTAVEELLKVAQQDPKIVGVAPKMLFYHDPAIFDSIGNLIDWHGAAFNQGIGQVDIGQYDQIERTFGVCFGAAFLRRSAFNDKEVGPLDESYFMYYEDVDWCYRANLFGYKFYTAPRAVVYHVHSAAARELPYSFKYRLIERNLLRTVYKNYEFTSVIRILIRRYLTHLRSLLKGRFVKATLLILIEFLLDLPRLTLKRRRIQRRRKVDDFDVIRYSHGESAFFSPTKYSPDYSLAALEAMYKRLYLLNRDPKTREIYFYLHSLSISKLQFTGSWLKETLKKVLSDEPEVIQDFIQRMEEE